MYKTPIRIKHLEKKLAKKGIYYDDVLNLYTNNFAGMFFTSRNHAYSGGLNMNGYKFIPLELFFKNAKLVYASGLLSYYNPKKGGIK